MKIKVLVVDDSSLQRKILCDLLRNDGYDVAEASNGEEGLRAAAEYRPNLILTDIEMPVVDGISMCKQLRENPATGRIPIVVLSAHGDAEDVMRGMEAGAMDYITKDSYGDESVLVEVRMLISLAEQAIGNR